MGREDGHQRWFDDLRRGLGGHALNSRRGRVATFAISLLATTGLVLGQGITSPASAAEVVVDGGFETTPAGGNNPSWTEAGTAFPSPLCTIADCGGAPGPFAGTWWAWFGGSATASTSSLSQSVTIPAGTASLSFQEYAKTVNTPFNATLVVKMDAVVLTTYTEPAVAEPAYALKTFDVSAFAGGIHTLSFEYTNPAANTSNFYVDNVSIAATPPVPDTTITKTPKKNQLKTTKRKAKVAFSFSSATAGATFECSIDAKPFAACTSGTTFKVKVGKHTFAVRAVSAGGPDPSPATYSFKVKKKSRR
jgi:hypothetical protein